MKPTRTCILIADGRSAKFFSNNGPGKGLEALSTLNLSRSRMDGELTDQPGRVFDRAGSGRHAMEPHTDVARRLERDFLKDVVARLETAFVREKFDRLVLIAPPQAIADLRDLLPDQLARRVKAELVKDLTHLPTEALVTHIDEVLPVSQSSV